MNDGQDRQLVPIHFSRDVTLHFQEKSYGPCPVKHLSLGKICVIGEFEENVGESCQVVFMQTGATSDLIFKALAQVIRVDSEGLAIEFTSMTFDTFMFLQSIQFFDPEEKLQEEVEQWYKL